MTESPESAASRKNDHIRICAEEIVEPRQNTAFGEFDLEPCAFPEMALEDVDTHQSFLGHRFSLPLLITGMTGGVERGQLINETLARAAEQFQIPMGLGSQKIMLLSTETRRLFDVRKVAPRVFLIGNLGAVSLNYGITASDVARLVDDLKLDAFALHINALQECVQPEGERNFSGLLPKIAALVKTLPVPIIIKEVGAGIDEKSFARLLETGVAAVDVGGQGGTSWSRIEGLRGDEESFRIGELFRDWGVPTGEALAHCARMRDLRKSRIELIATGGIRDGIQVAKAIGLGASLAGIGLPLLKKIVNANSSDAAFDAVSKELSFFARSLRIAMFCSGARDLTQLRDKVVRKGGHGSR